MNNLGGLFCPLCLNYFIRPVTTICAHSFCEFCLDEYFLCFATCPICDSTIRRQKAYTSNNLANFVQNFVRTQHPDYIAQFQNRMQKLSEYKMKKMLNDFHTGQKVDIRDTNYYWRVGMIIRIISRVGQTHKFVKVQYLDCEQKLEQQLKVTSQKLAKYGFYTNRDDIPKYLQFVKKQKELRKNA